MNPETSNNNSATEQPLPNPQDSSTASSVWKWIIGFIAVGFIFVLFSLPAIQQTRETGPRYRSKNNLKQLGLALHNYYDDNHTFPPGATVDANALPQHSWMTLLLPYVDKKPLYDSINIKLPWNAQENFTSFSTIVRDFHQPKIDEPLTSTGYATSHYSVNKNIFFDNSHFHLDDITDGLSNTIFAGEIKENLPAWGDPANRRDVTLGINTHPNGFGSPSKEGAYMLLGDGRVRFISNDIDSDILKALSTPNGDEDLTGREY